MAPRTDAEAVKATLGTSLSSLVIQGFVEDANIWVNANLAAGQCPSLTEDTLRVIEKYVAAYFVTLRDPRLTAAKFDDVSENYQVDPTKSEYLKAAASFDTCGVIHSLLVAPEKPLRFSVGKGFQDDVPSDRRGLPFHGA